MKEFWGYQKADGTAVCKRVYYDYGLELCAATSNKSVTKIIFRFWAADYDDANMILSDKLKKENT